MTEFKVGDLVRHTKSRWIGEVVRIRLFDGFPYFVEWDDEGDDDWYRADALELVTPDSTVYRLVVPPAPPEHVTRVRPAGRVVPEWVRAGPNAWYADGNPTVLQSWEYVVRYTPDGVEPAEPESEYDVAVRWMRANPGHAKDTSVARAGSTVSKHAAAIVRKVLADEPASAGPDIGTVLRELLDGLKADRIQARDERAAGRVAGITAAMHRVERLIERHTGEAAQR